MKEEREQAVGRRAERQQQRGFLKGKGTKVMWEAIWLRISCKVK